MSPNCIRGCKELIGDINIYKQSSIQKRGFRIVFNFGNFAVATLQQGCLQADFHIYFL